MVSRPAWSTELVPRQAPKLQTEKASLEKPKRKKKKKVIFFFFEIYVCVDMCICVDMYTCAGAHRDQKGKLDHLGLEPPSVVAGNQTWVLCKSSK